MEHYNRHAIIWRIARPVCNLIVKLKFNYRCPVYDLEGPLLVVSNHVTDLDPLMVGSAFRNHMYFVGSEHIMRQGFLSRLLGFVQPIIIRQKGGSGAGAVKSMLHELKQGHSVALFPEGNRTWDGVTRDFPRATGKLARTCGATLVTFRLKGGYFSSPRWAGSDVHKGEMYGDIVNVYTPDQLREMSVDEVNAAIAADIYEDAYETQKKHRIRFRSEHCAEGLESLLFICPRCGKMHRMRSYDNKFFCGACGTELRFGSSGFFSGEGTVFNNIYDWRVWQSEKIRGLCEKADYESPIFQDGGFAMWRITESGKAVEYVGGGYLRLFKDHLELPTGICVPMEELIGISVRGQSELHIGTANGSNFELKSEELRCTEKYIEACGFLGSPAGSGI